MKISNMFKKTRKVVACTLISTILITGAAFTQTANAENNTEINIENDIENDIENNIESSTETNQVLPDEDEQVYHMLYFDANGGQALPKIPYFYKTGSLISRPGDPEPSVKGYYVAGWYTDKECTKEWNFDTDRMGDTDIILYAKWDNTYTVEFRDSFHGTLAPTITVKAKCGEMVQIPDKTIERPILTEAHSSKIYYLFDGWYTDPSYSPQSKIFVGLSGNEFIMPDHDMVVYAKYDKNVAYCVDNPRAKKTLYSDELLSSKQYKYRKYFTNYITYPGFIEAARCISWEETQQFIDLLNENKIAGDDSWAVFDGESQTKAFAEKYFNGKYNGNEIRWADEGWDYSRAKQWYLGEGVYCLWTSDKEFFKNEYKYYFDMRLGICESANTRDFCDMQEEDFKNISMLVIRKK